MARKSPTQQMCNRMIAVAVAVSIVLVGVCGASLFNIMIIHGKKYSTEAADQQLKTVTLKAERGDIYDCNGKVLATSATVWTAYIVPKNLNNDTEKARLIADGLAEILEIESDTVFEKTQKNTAYEKIKSKIEEPEAEKVREFISQNKVGSIIGLESSTKRYYPNGSMASTVLGFVGDDNQGLSGIEYQYDSELEGVPGKLVASKNAQGGDMPFNYETMVEATPGGSVKLTIDEYVQHVCEKYLEEAVTSNSATNRGCVVVMNVKTGDVLGMATKPDFDPNQPFVLYSEADQKIIDDLAASTTDQKEIASKRTELLEAQWKNKAITDTYEPGSVFKIITGSAALEEKKVTTDSSFNCPGYIVIAGTRYNCHQVSGHGAQNFINIFENSCNPAFIEIGQRLGSTLFYNYFKAFGFTQKTGIDLPGETTGVYYTADQMGPVELASESFGQTFRITPMQMITAVAAVANGGYYVKPHIVKELLDNNGNVIKSFSTERQRQVISDETSQIICRCMNSVVENGSGKNAYVAGYRMCGKTGTSQKIDKVDESGSMLYVSSFCGFAPADDPEYAIIVIVDEPRAGAYYGSVVSAPVAASIMGDILPYLGVEAKYTDDEFNSMTKVVPNTVGMTPEQAKNALSAVGFSYTVKGNGETVLRQTPDAGTNSPSGGTVVLYTTEEGGESNVTVPDFNGMSVDEVQSTANNAGLTVNLYGIKEGEKSGAQCYKQSIDAGASVEYGSVITVYFRYSDAVE